MDTPNDPGPPPGPSRRLVLGGGAGLGLAVAGGLVLRNQIRHPPRDKRSRPDGRFRRVTLACPHPAHDPVLTVAERDGVFSRYNLEVTVLGGAVSGQQALDQLHPSGAEVAVAPALSWLPRLLSGLDARLICGLQSGSSRLLVDRRSPIRRIEDLNRRAIGLVDTNIDSRDSADRLFFSIMMRRKGMNPDRDVSWVQVASDQIGPGLASRQLQAVAGHDPVVWQARETLHLTELASSMTGSYGVRVSRVLGVRADVLRDDPAASVSLVLAFQEAAETVARHIGETASLLADQLPDMQEAAVERMLRAEGHALPATGIELRDQIAQYIDELKLIGRAQEDQDSGQLARRLCASVVHR